MIKIWRRWREQQTLKRRAIPVALWQQTLDRFPFLAQLNTEDGRQLKALSTLFLARKEFNGAHDLPVTDEMAVAIAAQACLPILHLGLDWYDGFIGIIIHLDEVVARREVMDEDGVVHAYDDPLSGEAMEGGPVTLSWKDVAEAGDSAATGYNVVIHEFAHVLDMRNGQADGIPPMASRAEHANWQTVLGTAFESFCERIDAGEDTLLDPYAAEAPSEFFAVACESFFVSPLELQEEHAEVYALLRSFFHQDPASRFTQEPES